MNEPNDKVSAGRGGPFLTAAFFCDRIIEDKSDDSMTAVRFLDKIKIILDPSAPANVPSEEHRIPVSLFGLVAFKTGDSPGKHTIRIDLVSPSGKVGRGVFEQVFMFPQEPVSGVNVRLVTTISIKNGGLFWMQVYLDDILVTQVPVEILVERAGRPLKEIATVAS